ncbi:nitrogen regulatory protein P-II family [Nitrosospira multiformis]|uniref:Nitrogen regulatory protein P-II family n=1 Tax=Nitrosospira multiformis TaxID=1231 RepID=A0A1H8C2U8_9PROT|nr:P-II family nitrogen regulator [Nitrosospira multiformis]SEM89400.1 nitrogen regulatory protein P-II family [Nitrosospira multiformis]
MKEIRAICRPDRLYELRRALRAIPGFPGLTVLEAKGFSAPVLIDNPSLKEALTDFTGKVMLCTLVADDMVDSITDVIMREGRTGQIGDGLIWVLPVESARRIRDGSNL